MTRRGHGHRLRRLLIAVMLVVLAAGCSDVQLRPSDACSLEATGDSTHPFHTIDIDRENDFATRQEGFYMQAADTTYRVYLTWDPCRIYFGMKAPVIGGSPCPPDDPTCTHLDVVRPRNLMLYVDTDPLGDHGTSYINKIIEKPLRLPFMADYLVELRTHSRPLHRGESHRFTGNAQMYRRAIRWSAGLIRHWEPMDTDALQLAVDREASYLEFSIDRAALGHPCALRVVAWVTDQATKSRELFWPPPDHLPGRDSLSLNYYGFNLLDDVTPNTPSNFNRTDFVSRTSCPPDSGA